MTAMLDRLKRHVPWALQRTRRREWLSIVARKPASIRWFIPWLRSQRAAHSPLNDAVPWIPFAAMDWLARQLRPEQRAFEWGSGGSTLFLAERVRELFSVEHDPDWYALVKAKLDERKLSRCDYRLVTARQLADGEPTRYGSGQRGAERLDFEAYVKVIDEHPDGHFDLVLIDGRARMACLEAAWAKTRVGGFIFVDNSNYPRYAQSLAPHAGFERVDIEGVSPYRGKIWSQSTVFHRRS